MYASFKEWNDAYTKSLQKRNKAQRDYDAAWRDPAAQAKAKIRLDKAELAAREIGNAERPSGHVMRNRAA